MVNILDILHQNLDTRLLNLSNLDFVTFVSTLILFFSSLIHFPHHTDQHVIKVCVACSMTQQPAQQILVDYTY